MTVHSHRTLVHLAGAIGLLMLPFSMAAPAAASPQGLGGSAIGVATDVAVQTLQMQERRGRTGTTSRGSSSTRSADSGSSRGGSYSAPSSRSRSDTRGRTNTGVRRGGDYRSGRGNGRGYYGGYRGYYGRTYYPYYYPGWYSSFYWWGPPAYYSAYRGGSDDYYAPDSGALDLDIKPEDAEVWVDGEYVGIADNYDGFPRYLWLAEGDHRLVFYLDGYRTAAREFTIERGVVLQVKTQLDEGESKPAAELFPKSETRAQARIDTDRARAEALRERRPYRYSDRDRADSDTDEDESWRERRASAASNDRGAAGADGAPTGDFRVEPARLILDIDPSDAVVYLDGRLLGSGEELARLHSAMLIDAGEHELEVVRPGYDSETVEFEAKAGEDVELEIELDRD